MVHAIYLSPHLDDAALSCGGQIAQQTAVGRRVLIVTVMAGDPPGTGLSDYAQALHGRWQLAQDVVAARRAEDITACTRLRADYQHWTIPDCIYRMHPASGQALYADWAQITGDVPAAERPLIAGLAAQLAQLPAAERIIAPLAVGNHVDHQIVRQAAEAAFGHKLVYYEDYPYGRDPQAVAAVIDPDSSHWQAQVIPLSASALQARIEAIAAFTSQLSTFFDGRADLEQQMAAHAAAIGGERLWWRTGHMDA